MHSTLCNFFVAMTLFPEVQRKAQVELDTIVGPSRLPDFTDRDKLPYINAIVKEILRWNNVGPLGIAHSNTSDAEYEGYFIPANSAILVNVWYEHTLDLMSNDVPHS